MFDCTTPRYDALYARWLSDPGRLLDLAAWAPGMTLLDLCGGTGAVTREALRRGARPEDITLLDINPRWQGAAGVRVIKAPAEFLGSRCRLAAFDVVVCRQAMAYLSISGMQGVDLLAGLALQTKIGGRFVFNTFVRPRWAWKSYEHESRAFTEISGYLGRRVFHVQWARGPGGGIDFTVFRWHDNGDIMRRLNRFFAVKQLATERSVRWVCTRRDHV